MKPIILICVFCTANLLALICLFCTAGAASAQPPVMPPPSQEIGQRFPPPSAVDRLLRHLQLTDAQRVQLRPYLDALQPQLTAIREQARQAEATLITQLSSQIQPFLTSDQQARLEALRVLQTAPAAQVQRKD